MNTNKSRSDVMEYKYYRIVFRPYNQYRRSTVSSGKEFNFAAPMLFDEVVEKELNNYKIEHKHIYLDPEMEETDKYIRTNFTESALRKLFEGVGGFRIVYLEAVDQNIRAGFNDCTVAELFGERKKLTKSEFINEYIDMV